MLCVEENIFLLNCQQESRVKVRNGSENVRRKSMNRNCLLYPSVYLDIISMRDKFLVMIR